MKHLLTCLALALVVCLVPAPAGARDYVVHSCKLPDGTTAPTDGWKATGVAPYMWFDDACARGGSLTAGLAGSLQPANHAAVGWGFSSGEATIRGYRIVRSGWPRGFNGGASMLVYSSDAENSSITGKQLDYCAASWGCAAVDGQLIRPTGSTPSGSKAWFFSIVCGGGWGEQCTLSPGARDFGSLRIEQASFTLDDSEQPAVQNVEGSLEREAASFGELRFVASDRISGVRRAIAEIDGAAVASSEPDSRGAACNEVRQSALPDFTLRRPCPDRAQLELVVPRSAVTPGTHSLRVRVFDAAGNATTVIGPREITAQGVTASAGARFAPENASSLRARFGHKLQIGGVLLAANGQPIPGAEIEVETVAPAAARSARRIRVVTNPAGRYLARIAATANSRITLSHAASGAKFVHGLSVRSRLRLSAASPRVRPLGKMLLRGKIQTARAKRRASVAIKVRSGRRWKTIGISQASLDGRFAFSYRFRRTRSARFAFRAEAIRSGDLAVDPSPSRTIYVRVG